MKVVIKINFKRSFISLEVCIYILYKCFSPLSLSVQVAEENGLEALSQLEGHAVSTREPGAQSTTAAGIQTLTTEEEDRLSSRLAALRQPN